MITFKEIISVVVTNLIVFLALLSLTRITGKKQLSQLTFFNYVTGITLGSIASDAVNIRLLDNYDDYIALICWPLFTIIVSFISLKIKSSRTLIDGQPTIIIKKGKIQKKALKKLLLSVDDLVMLLRVKDVFKLNEVDYAILEPNGQLAVLKVENKENVIKEDMKIKTKKRKFVTTKVIIEGSFIDNNLEEIGISKDWILKELKKQGVKDYKEVLYAEVQDDGSLYVDEGE
jgi:uncharacterized membrane protein YcaP (DUF421 family)